MDIALFQPDQPPNTGTIMRLSACMKTPLHVIEPCGFPFSVKSVKRYAMDYADHLDLHHHIDWDSFNQWRTQQNRRLVLLTTKAAQPYCDFSYQADDILLVGSESAGAPDFVHDAADARIIVPMAPEVRSLNVAVSISMVLGEAIRQTNLWPV